MFHGCQDSRYSSRPTFVKRRVRKEIYNKKGEQFNEKNIIIIIIGIVIAIAVCFTVIFILKHGEAKDIKLGMTKEEVISILDNNKYKYTIENTSDTYIQIITDTDKILLEKIKGNLLIGIKYNKVNGVTFLPNIEETKKDKQIQKLNSYLIELYGEPYEDEIQGDIYKFWWENDMIISLKYPKENNKIIDVEIKWKYQDINEE